MVVAFRRAMQTDIANNSTTPTKASKNLNNKHYGITYIAPADINISNIKLDGIDILSMYYKQFILIKEKHCYQIIIANPEQLLSIENDIKNHATSYKFYTTEHDYLKLTINQIISKFFYDFSTETIDISRLINHIINDANHHSASDIHLEISNTACRLRFRIDGILSTITNIPQKLHSAMISRIKVLAQLDITEKRKPQDGHFSFKTYQNLLLECRVSSCPTIFGEKIVIRILNKKKHALLIHELGMNQTCQDIFTHTLKQPQGLILITGPTGSGKTQTLYSALHLLNTDARNIITLEDPVEMQLNGINQININKKIGLDFSNMLRFILRQDPDIIMIGEIRDHETAEISFQAANTGHLVLATLHTHNAIETIERLGNLGIQRSTIAQSLQLIISQRLVRMLCSCQKTKSTETCLYCTNGYSGRVGIFEFLEKTNSVYQLLNESSSNEELKKHLSSSLSDAARHHLNAGNTDQREINRVLGEVNDIF